MAETGTNTDCRGRQSVVEGARSAQCCRAVRTTRRTHLVPGGEALRVLRGRTCHPAEGRGQGPPQAGPQAGPGPRAAAAARADDAEAPAPEPQAAGAARTSAGARRRVAALVVLEDGQQPEHLASADGATGVLEAPPGQPHARHVAVHTCGNTRFMYFAGNAGEGGAVGDCLFMTAVAPYG